MPHPDEGTIHAWLDGALGAAESERLEAHVARCAECAAAVAEARGLIAGASRVLGALDAVPAGVLPPDDRVVPIAARRSRGVPRWALRYGAVAATLVLAATSVYVVRREMAPSVDLAARNESPAPGGMRAELERAAAPASPPAAEGAGFAAPEGAVSKPERVAERVEGRTAAAAPAPPRAPEATMKTAAAEPRVAAMSQERGIAGGMAASRIAPDAAVAPAVAGCYEVVGVASAIAATDAPAMDATAPTARRRASAQAAAPAAAPAAGAVVAREAAAPLATRLPARFVLDTTGSTLSGAAGARVVRGEDLRARADAAAGEVRGFWRDAGDGMARITWLERGRPSIDVRMTGAGGEPVALIGGDSAAAVRLRRCR